MNSGNKCIAKPCEARNHYTGLHYKYFLGGETATKIPTGDNSCITKVDIIGNTRDAVSDWTAINASI